MMKTDLQPIDVVMVDDNPDHLEMLSLALTDGPRSMEALPVNVIPFTEAADALAGMPAGGRIVILCDYRMPGSTGLDWLPDFIRCGVGPVILLTGEGDEQIAAQAFKAGASDYLVKTDVMEQPELLQRAIREALRRYTLEQRNKKLSRELKLANREMEKKNALLRELTDTAHRFVDNVAHEFRTPLTVIREFASIIDDGIGGDVTEKQHDYLQFIVSATRDLAQLVDDFLDSSKLKAKMLPVNRQAYTAAEIIDAVKPMLECRAAGRSITLEVEIKDGLNKVYADREKVGRILINLSVNAIKFSPPESMIRIWAAPHEDGGVQFGITDRGPGLSPDECAVIFERFQQVGDMQRSSTKGFGLGLNIAKELIWLNLGEVNVVSEEGKGSTFSFTLPSCDPETVLNHYLEHGPGRSASAPLSVLSCTPIGPGTSTEAVRSFLCGASYPMDLVLPAVDGSSVTLLGETAEPDKWMQRINAMCAANDDTNPDHKAPPFELRWLGSWLYPQQKETILSNVLGRTMGLGCCA